MLPKRKCSIKHHEYYCFLFQVRNWCPAFPHSTFFMQTMRKLWETGNWVWNKTVKAAFKQIIIITDYFDEFLKAIVFKTVIVFSWKKSGKLRLIINPQPSTLCLMTNNSCNEVQSSPKNYGWISLGTARGKQ